MAKAFKAQLEVKAKCEQLQQSLKDISDWTNEMKQMDARQQQKDEECIIPPIRSHIDEMHKFIESQHVIEKKHSSVGCLISSEYLGDAELLNKKGIEFCKRTKEGEECNTYKERYAQTAIEMFTNAIELNDQNPAFYVNRALCYFNLERYEETISDCDVAISLDANHVTAHYRRMKAFEHLGNNKRAYLSCQELLKLINNEKELVKIKQDMERIETRLRQEADKLKLQGNTQLANKNYVKACECFSNAIVLFGSDPIYYHSRSLCYFHLKNYDDCLTDCNTAIELDKGYFRPYYQRMRVREQKGEYLEAIIDCKKFLELVKDDRQRLTAKKDLERLQRTFEREKEPNSFKWSELSKNASLINFIQKPPHLRSKKPLKRIQISEVNSSCDTKNTPSNYVVASDYEMIPDAVIDKMFNNNTGERVDDLKHDTNLENLISLKSMSKLKNYFSPPVTPSSPPKDISCSRRSPVSVFGESVAGTQQTEEPKFILEPKLALSAPLEHKVDINLSKTKLEKDMINQGNYQTEVADSEGIQKYGKMMPFSTIPTTTVEFYQTWINLPTLLDKFEFLKVVEHRPLDKLLGVNLSSSMLSDILLLLDQYCEKQNHCPLRILTKIGDNSQMGILVLMLSDKDRDCLTQLLTFMQSKEENSEAVREIKKRFDI